MSLQKRVKQLEEQAATPEQRDRLWQETLDRLTKVYGDDPPLSDDAPLPTFAEVDAMIGQAYAGHEV
jgi:hypothetical protein